MQGTDALITGSVLPWGHLGSDLDPRYSRKAEGGGEGAFAALVPLCEVSFFFLFVFVPKYVLAGGVGCGWRGVSAAKKSPYARDSPEGAMYIPVVPCRWGRTGRKGKPGKGQDQAKARDGGTGWDGRVRGCPGGVH